MSLIKLVLLATPFLCVMAAFALDRLQRQEAPQETRPKRGRLYG
jgi:hypothetical protein